MPAAQLQSVPETDLWVMWNEERLDAAAAELWHRSQRLAVAIAARALAGLADPREQARELVDEAFVRALRSFDPSRASTYTEHPFRAWFLRVVRGAAIDTRRRAARQVEIADVAVGNQAATAPSPDDRIDASRLVRMLQEWNATEGLEEDWPVLVAWLQCRHDGVRVPWKDLAADHPISAPAPVAFSPEAASTPLDDPALAAVRRKLDLCPRLCLAADGGRRGPEPEQLAVRRVRWVVDTVLQTLQVQTARHRGTQRKRLVEGASDGLGRWVRFRTIAGERRSPDALRMRVEKVILGKVLRLVQGGDV